MGFTLTESDLLHLSEIIDCYKHGRIHLDDLSIQIGCGVRQLEHKLLASDEFLQVLDAAQHYSATDGQPIFAYTLASAHAYRVSLLGIPRNVCIPLHDHPNMVSVVVFLSGMIHSPIYGVWKDSGNSLVELKSYSDRSYLEGEVAVLTPGIGNLHSMQALSTRAACLSLQLSMSSGLGRQAYFFPAVADVAGNDPTLWYRLPLRRYADGA
jgi:hypothetical protein